LEKKTIFVISDHPFASSGVGTQTRYFIEALLKTERYKFVCFGGAVKHKDMTPQKVEGYEEDWIIHPTEGYGKPDTVRSLIATQKPDLLWFMTDPRFYGWLWDIENEVRKNVPMLYYHVWDNYPYPKFNQYSYESNDVIAAISKVTYDIVQTVAPSVESHYLPHAVDNEAFKKHPDELVQLFVKENLSEIEGKTTFFWNNRNARRKLPGTLIYYFNEFAKKVGPENVCLIMHTDVKDEHGQDLEKMIIDLEADDGRIIFSTQKMSKETLGLLYNAVDCTVNISDAEGFGLSTEESLSCETPIIVSMTGGLQEQVTDGEEWFGIGIQPASRAVIGSLQVPYIYEDRISGEDLVDAFTSIYNMSPEERDELGRKGSEYIRKNYGFEKYCERWVELIDSVCEKYGSWDTRKHYQAWELREIL
jgi:glycosyltransferase involved in cell wall biosynthesis